MISYTVSRFRLTFPCFLPLLLVLVIGYVVTYTSFLQPRWYSLSGLMKPPGATLQATYSFHEPGFALSSTWSLNWSLPLPVSSQSRIATLGVADSIYVISLPTRMDRRHDMEILRQTLGLLWTLVDATSFSTDRSVLDAILAWVGVIRRGPPFIVDNHDFHDGSGGMAMLSTGRPILNYTEVSNKSVPFAWPANIDHLANSFEYLELWDTSEWSAPSFTTPESKNGLASSGSPSPEPLACLEKDYSPVPLPSDNSSAIPEHLLLSPGRIACWHSHISVIHTIANLNSTNSNTSRSGNDVSIILEDDVDMERGIRERLVYLWKYLPDDWDIVFLGHCWSNESFYPAISPPSPDHAPSFLIPTSTLLSHPSHIPNSTQNKAHPSSFLHPSNRPKCTHAYALSRRGARRLLLHLRYPPFAYSRAIDQAFAWLIVSGRMKSFSVVPSVVVQRKVGLSDIGSGVGSKWRDSLWDGVLGAIGVDNGKE